MSSISHDVMAIIAFAAMTGLMLATALTLLVVPVLYSMPFNVKGTGS